MPFITKMYFFSEVRGVVLDHGKPIAGAEIERTFKSSWRGEKGTDYAQTDSEGRFYFGPIVRSSFLAGILPHQPVITQKILIKINNKILKAWVCGKSDYDENGELGGKPINITCDISHQPTYKDEFFGICQIR